MLKLIMRQIFKLIVLILITIPLCASIEIILWNKFELPRILFSSIIALTFIYSFWILKMWIKNMGFKCLNCNKIGYLDMYGLCKKCSHRSREMRGTSKIKRIKKIRCKLCGELVPDEPHIQLAHAHKHMGGCEKCNGDGTMEMNNKLLKTGPWDGKCEECDWKVSGEIEDSNKIFEECKSHTFDTGHTVVFLVVFNSIHNPVLTCTYCGEQINCQDEEVSHTEDKSTWWHDRCVPSL